MVIGPHEPGLIQAVAIGSHIYISGLGVRVYSVKR